jgi:glycerophosphoryl diester phosphodiesterase
MPDVAAPGGAPIAFLQEPFAMKTTLGLLALAAGLWCAAAASPPVPAAAATFDMQSHRGGRGLWPENTLVAFGDALRLGTTTLEMDAAVTADGVVVISHDPALNPAFTRDASGRFLKERGPLIRSLSFAQLLAYDVGRLNPEHRYGLDFTGQTPADGARVPRLEAVFELVEALGAEAVQFNIETKINPSLPDETLAPEPFVDALLAVIRAHGMVPRVMVQSFDWRTLELLHRKEPGLRTVYLSIESQNMNTLRDGSWNAGHRLVDHGGSVPRLVRASAGQASGVIWAPFFRNLTPESLKEAQALGLKVVPWTVNQVPDMDRLIAWGVDGLISDYPDRLREAMAARGLPLPRGVGKP